MAESSRFWTTGTTNDGASTYTADNMGQFIRETFMTNLAAEGVLYGILNALVVSGTSSPVAVASGAALVYGFYYTNSASVNVAISTPATNPRIDRIVLRVDWANHTVRITRIAGTEAASPSAPSLTQVANTTWDIPLAQVRITTGGVITVTDERTYVKHPGVYGWLNSALSVNAGITASGNITATKSNAGTYNEVAVNNTSNTAGSYARFNAAVGGASADDPLMTWSITGVQTWAMGLDNSDSDKMKIAPYSVIGSGDVLTLDSSGNLTVTGAVSASSLNASQLGSGTVPLERLSGITTGNLAADSVDDTIAGSRVPQFYRRQGGSATDWSSAGTSTQTPTSVRMQGGSFTVPSSSSPTTVTFPTAFSQPPLIVATAQSDGVIVTVSSVGASSFGVLARLYNGNYPGAVINWVAIGAE